MADTPEQNQPTRLPSLNGWRALSIMIVLICHYSFCSTFPFEKKTWQNWFDGNLGVRRFFTISGFLITWLLICEKEKTRTVSLKNFYIRRSLRILPVYFSVLLVLWIMHLYRHSSSQGGAIWFGILTFTRNFFGLDSDGGLESGHLWSLSIEEQFYLFWPVTFKLLINLKSGRKSLYWLLGIILLVSPVIRSLSLLGEYPAKLRFSLFSQFSTFMYLDCLAYGCLTAFLLFYERRKIEKFVEKWNILIPLISSFLIFVPYVSKLGNAFQAIGFSMLILYTILNPKSYLYKFLNLKWISFVGVLSYSLYMWQEFLWNIFYLGKFWVLSIVPIFGIACLSYFFIEKPFLKMRNYFRGAQ
jgi:peptidoglycan/LPS O-acetylase OafA/YrhL